MLVMFRYGIWKQRMQKVNYGIFASLIYNLSFDQT